MSTHFEILVTDEFKDWYEELEEHDADRVFFVVGLLEEKGTDLGFPHSSSIKNSSYPLRELRVQSKGHPLRILYAFNPERNALLILGGDKTGDLRWYDKNIPIAERLWEEHLEELD
ncbi:MAG: type II toxin-antitoxin system RelE/ParE family toxin [Bacteroidota bacterium]